MFSIISSERSLNNQCRSIFNCFRFDLLIFIYLIVFGFCHCVDTYHLNINELYLETHVRGQPHPKIDWFKDSADILRTDPKYQVFDHPDGLCELIVNFPNSGDR